MELIIVQIIRVKMSKRGKSSSGNAANDQTSPPDINLPGLIELISPADDLSFEKPDLMTIKHLR